MIVHSHSHFLDILLKQEHACYFFSTCKFYLHTCFTSQNSFWKREYTWLNTVYYVFCYNVFCYKILEQERIKHLTALCRFQFLKKRILAFSCCCWESPWVPALCNMKLQKRVNHPYQFLPALTYFKNGSWSLILNVWE